VLIHSNIDIVNKKITIPEIIFLTENQPSKNHLNGLVPLVNSLTK